MQNMWNENRASAGFAEDFNFALQAVKLDAVELLFRRAENYLPGRTGDRLAVKFKGHVMRIFFVLAVLLTSTAAAQVPGNLRSYNELINAINSDTVRQIEDAKTRIGGW